MVLEWYTLYPLWGDLVGELRPLGVNGLRSACFLTEPSACSKARLKRSNHKKNSFRCFFQVGTMNYPIKPGFNLCTNHGIAPIWYMYSVKTWFKKISLYLILCIYVIMGVSRLCVRSSVSQSGSRVKALPNAAFREYSLFALPVLTNYYQGWGAGKFFSGSGSCYFFSSGSGSGSKGPKKLLVKFGKLFYSPQTSKA